MEVERGNSSVPLLFEGVEVRVFWPALEVGVVVISGVESVFFGGKEVGFLFG